MSTKIKKKTFPVIIHHHSSHFYFYISASPNCISSPSFLAPVLRLYLHARMPNQHASLKISSALD